MGSVEEETKKNQYYKINQRHDEDEIVISGISGRYPESENLDEFWENLLSGCELVSADDRRWPVCKYQHVDLCIKNILWSFYQ